jgi:hypothetical protein
MGLIEGDGEDVSVTNELKFEAPHRFNTYSIKLVD